MGKIPYVVPIATQTLVALPKDTEGIEINNIYDMRPEVRMQNIHIGVFPMNDYSIVYAFIIDEIGYIEDCIIR